jgi:nucleoside diphosphate kinase
MKTRLCTSNLFLKRCFSLKLIFCSNKNRDAVASLEGDHCLALDLIKNDAVGILKALAGPETVEEARKTAPDSLHAQFGVTGLKNGVHVSRSADSAQKVVLIL